MPDFVIRPTADGDFSNALFFSGTTPVAASGLTNGTSYQAYMLSAASDAFTPVAATGGVQTWVSLTGGQNLNTSAVAGNVNSLTLAMVLRPDEVSGTTGIYSISGRSAIQKVADGLRILLKDTGNGVAYDGTIPGVFAVGQAVHIYIGADFHAGTLTVEIDGVVPSNPTVPFANFAPGTVATDLDRTIVILGGWVGDVASYFIDGSASQGAPVANSALYNGGTSPDLTGLSPLALFGEDQTATQWNAGTNLGTGGNFNVTGTLSNA